MNLDTKSVIILSLTHQF